MTEINRKVSFELSPDDEQPHTISATLTFEGFFLFHRSYFRDLDGVRHNCYHVTMEEAVNRLCELTGLPPDKAIGRSAKGWGWVYVDHVSINKRDLIRELNWAVGLHKV